MERRVAQACKGLFGGDVEVELTRPEEQFGDFSTNAALQLAPKLGRKPRDIADELAGKLRETLAPEVGEVSVAGPGFINLRLNDAALLASLDTEPARIYDGQEILVEFGDPNPFKAMHIGHLYSYVAGDAICNLLEAAGAQVKRLSYHGDVGLHVAKAIWAMRKSGYDDTKIVDVIKEDVGRFYAEGAKAYEEDEQARQEIDTMNRQVYGSDPAIRTLYAEGKQHSLDSFRNTLDDMGISNDRQYMESESAHAGLDMVIKNTGKVFTESDGAVVYEGEKVGLHTRVFITGKGLPTYEAKDLGLTELKAKDYPDATLSIVITAHEQSEYFKVMLAALAEIDPDTAKRTKHLAHGFVSLSSGKMSSRTGDVYHAVDLLADVEKAAEKLFPGTAHDIRVGAVKYEFAKHRLGGDLVYDVAESVSLEGNSGPYLQYAHARACSILRKADKKPGTIGAGTELEPAERTLARKISQYPEAVDKAVAELMPHHICTYLYELAQVFNRFYEGNRVVGDPRQDLRLALVEKYVGTLKSGLRLLGIAAPDKM